MNVNLPTIRSVKCENCNKLMPEEGLYLLLEGEIAKHKSNGYLQTLLDKSTSVWIFCSTDCLKDKIDTLSA